MYSNVSIDGKGNWMQQHLPSLPKVPSVKEAQAVLEAKRDQGWIALVLEYGKNFIIQSTLTTCDPDIAQTLLMHRPHTQQRSALYKLARIIVPGSTGVL